MGNSIVVRDIGSILAPYGLMNTTECGDQGP